MSSVDVTAVVNELLDKIKQLILDNAVLKTTLDSLHQVDPNSSMEGRDLSQESSV